MGFTIDGCIHRLSASHWERRRLAGAMRLLPTQLPAGRRRSQQPKPYRQPGEALLSGGSLRAWCFSADFLAGRYGWPERYLMCILLVARSATEPYL